MLRRLVIDSLRPGWSARRARRFALLASMVRVAVALFVLHVSGAAHLLSDVLLDDDMTCVDELARKAHDGLTSPVCPACESIGHGQAVALPEDATVTILPSVPSEVAKRRSQAVAPPSAPSRSIDRPPQS